MVGLRVDHPFFSFTEPEPVMPREATFENALAFAAELIRIPGLSGHEEDVARRVREEMEALGLKDIRVDSAGNVIGVAKGRGEAPPGP